MREILFRGKRMYSENEWIYGSVIQCEDCATIWSNKIKDDVEVDQSTVGQYTGLSDKNGVKIFEGDIIKCTICYDVGCYPTYVSEIKVVKFQNGYFSPLQSNISDYKVIGNIYDNPDLLTCCDNV